MTLWDKETAAVLRGEYARRLGLRVVDSSRTTARLALPFSQAILNRGGRVHGGAIASVVLCAARLATAASEENRHDQQVHILGAHIAFLERPAHGDVVATGEVIRRGRDLAHVTVRAADTTGTLVAMSHVTAAIGPGHDGDPLTVSSDGDADLDDGGTPVLMSPYLSGAGFRVMPLEDGLARARLPLAANRMSGTPRMDEGGISGLIDSCAAYAAHMATPGGDLRAGVTVSMDLFFHRIATEALEGRARGVSRCGDVHTIRVEVYGHRSGTAMADGIVIYRLAEPR
jgi:uncharacterized protein (TIGR00369 family)